MELDTEGLIAPWSWYKYQNGNLWQWWVVGPKVTIIARASTKQEALELAKKHPLYLELGWNTKL